MLVYQINIAAAPTRSALSPTNESDDAVIVGGVLAVLLIIIIAIAVVITTALVLKYWRGLKRQR